jgi:hypothetical protein
MSFSKVSRRRWIPPDNQERASPRFTESRTLMTNRVPERLVRSVCRLVVTWLAVAACGRPLPPETASGTPDSDGLSGLAGDLVAAQLIVADSGPFPAVPLTGTGRALCASGQEIRVYEYPTVGERVAAAAQIDPADASHVGTSMVEWAGAPRFWQRDRIIVLYLGDGQATEQVLTSILGQPFSRGGPCRRTLNGASC